MQTTKPVSHTELESALSDFLKSPSKRHYFRLRALMLSYQCDTLNQSRLTITID